MEVWSILLAKITDKVQGRILRGVSFGNLTIPLDACKILDMQNTPTIIGVS